MTAVVTPAMAAAAATRSPLMPQGGMPGMGGQRGGGRRHAAAAAADEDANHASHLRSESEEDLRGRRHPGACAARRERRCRTGRVPRGDGPVRLRQVDVHAHPGLPRPADVRPVHPRRPGRVEDVARTISRRCATTGSGSSSRASTCCRAPARSRTSNCRCSTAGEHIKAVGAPQARPGVARDRRPAAPLAPPPEPAVGRPAAARGDRARAHQQPVDPAGRRADGQPRHAARASRSWTCSSA